MDKKERLLERLTIAADLPDECIPGLPLVELYGDKRVLVEHHMGVTEYGRKQIRIRVKSGEICVCGRGLELSRMTRGQLVIRGQIHGITVNRG